MENHLHLNSSAKCKGCGRFADATHINDEGYCVSPCYATKGGDQLLGECWKEEQLRQIVDNTIAQFCLRHHLDASFFRKRPEVDIDTLVDAQTQRIMELFPHTETP
jgi:hypothetical protein